MEPKPPKPFQFEQRYKSRLYYEFYASKISQSTFRRWMQQVFGKKHHAKILSIGDQLNFIRRKGPPPGYFIPKEFRDVSGTQNLFLS